jgi:hypothetical protein
VDPYATHLPVLAAAVAAARPGAVLELGAGRYSTPVLHALCLATKRQLLTLDGNAAWIDQFTTYRSAAHRVELVSDWNMVVPSEAWAVVFVDHAPAEQRVVEIEKFRDACELMVVHDTEDLVHYGHAAALARFVHRVDYKRLVPWTSILSMTRDLSELYQI